MALGYQPPISEFEEIPLPRPPVRKPSDTEFPNVDKTPSPDSEDELEYAHRVRAMIEDAREFNAEILAPIRERGIRLYLGIDPAPENDGGEVGSSTIVATEVRDTVLQMIPSLMRIFSAQDNVTNFIPNNTSQADAAEQVADYLRYVFFYDNPGYSILQDVFKDGLIKAMGVVMWWTDENRETVEEEYHRLSMEQRQFVISQAGVEIVKMDSVPQQMPDGSTQPLFNLIVRRTKRQPKHCVAAVPPDEFRINRTAVSVKKAGLVGREYFETKTNLKLKGVPDDLIDEAADFSGGDMRFAAERMFRNQGADAPVGRDSAEPVCKYGEYWMRIDKDGDGLAELRHICVIGDNDDIVLDEPATRAKMAIACPDPEPHSIVGHGYAELVADLQEIRTNLMRGALDSLAQSIYPRLVGVDALVDWDDVLNTAIGAPIRVKEVGALTQLQYQFVGQPAFDMMDRLDAMRMARTGITPQSQGLDPKALQSTTMKGVDMIITGAQERIELVCRTMASTFMVDLMSGLLQEVTDNPVPERIVQLRGKYVPVNPSQFDATMTCVPNPAIGHGSDLDRFSMLTMIMQKQEMVIQSQGPGNPLVTPIEWRNTVEDIMAIAGMRNSARYFKPLDEKGLAAWMEQQQNKEDANLIFAKAEADKVRAQVIKTLTDARISAEEMTLKDDRERDKVEGDQMLKAADIDAKYGVQVDKAMIQGLWGAVRQPPEGPSGAEGSGGGAPQGPGVESSTAPPPGPPKPGGELTVGQGLPGAQPGGMPSGLLDGGPPAPVPGGALPGG
jgi:hypothetical protein